MIDKSTKTLLTRLAVKYETAAFLENDPSRFMHQVEGDANKEAMAFVAAGLSFGGRSQFMPKIAWLLECADGNVEGWIRNGTFARTLPCKCEQCFYRFFTQGAMHRFLLSYRKLLDEHGTLGEYVAREAGGDGFAAVKAICRWFSSHGSGGVVPQDTSSACKRLCMFLRWMVRDGSPVDIGIWANRINRRSLVMPMDTHVVHQSVRLGLLKGTTASMAAARRLTATLAEIFPDDPLRGDFALFGLGVSGGNA